MNVVYLTTAGTSVRRKGDRLQVWQRDEKIDDLRLFDLDRLVLVGPVQVTTQALALLLDRGIDVSFLTGRGRLRGSLVSTASRNVYLRLAQFDRFRDEPFRLALSQQIVTGKLVVQRRLLARYARNHPERLEPGCVDQIRALEHRVRTAETVDETRGFEGAGAAVYYRQFGRMLTTVGFPGRKKHPSTDPANALLSLGYVLVGNELAALAEAQGFDPAIGFLHGIRYGRQSLALDLVEVFRQPIVDRLTLRLFNRGQLTPADFEGGERGLRLSPLALKRYFGYYEDFLRGPSEGDRSPSWRERLAGQVEGLRTMVMDGAVKSTPVWAG